MAQSNFTAPWKWYVWAVAMLAASIVFIIFRGNPGMGAGIGAGIIWGFSVVWTYLGAKEDADNMWIRMAISTLSPIIIGFATA